MDGLLTRQCHLGVDLFFAISGFLMTTLLLREREQWERIRWSLRIFPLCFTVDLLYSITVLVFQRFAPAHVHSKVTPKPGAGVRRNDSPR